MRNKLWKNPKGISLILRLVLVAIMLVSAFGFIIQPAFATASIEEAVSPAPMAYVLNTGDLSESEYIWWQVHGYTTTPYLVRHMITNPTGAIVEMDDFPIAGGTPGNPPDLYNPEDPTGTYFGDPDYAHLWPVPAGAMPGQYFSWVRYYSVQSLQGNEPDDTNWELQAMQTFFVAQPLRIFKYNDLNGDGDYDPLDEYGLDNWNFNVTGPGGYSANGSTSGGGYLDLLPVIFSAGDYVITEDPKTNWINTNPGLPGDPGLYQKTITIPGEIADPADPIAMFGDQEYIPVETSSGVFVFFSTSAGTFTYVDAIPSITPTPDPPFPPDMSSANFPFGFFKFEIAGLDLGQTVTVTIRFPSTVSFTQYWKYHNDLWLPINMVNLGNNAYTFTLTDGVESLGDDDGDANGTIVDPGGPAISAPSTLYINANSLPDWDAKAVYPVQTLTVYNGTAPYKWAIKKGTRLPPGLKLKADKTNTAMATISGKPSMPGEFSFTVQATDNTGAVAEKTFTVFIYPAVSLVTPKLPAMEMGAPFPAWAPIASGGDGSYTWSTIGLPPGLIFDPSTGMISGTPTASGPSSVTLTVTDTSGGSASKKLSLKVLKPLTITTTTLPNGDPGVTYKSTTIKATGGTNKYVWSVIDGTLPLGLTLSPGGLIEGTPLPGSSGDYDITVQISDGLGIATQPLLITIYNPLTISPLPEGLAGVLYSHVLSATGGSGGYKFSVVGALPAWLKFTASTGTIAGTPVNAGTYRFVVKVTDSLKGTLTQTVTITIY